MKRLLTNTCLICITTAILGIKGVKDTINADFPIVDKYYSESKRIRQIDEKLNINRYNLRYFIKDNDSKIIKKANALAAEKDSLEKHVVLIEKSNEFKNEQKANNKNDSKMMVTGLYFGTSIISGVFGWLVYKMKKDDEEEKMSAVQKEQEKEKQKMLEHRMTEYLKENQEEPLIKKIIKNKTSFTKELEKFYRLKAEYGFEQALLQEKNKEYRKQAKTNKKSPEKTIDILQHLSQKDLNKTLLSYDKIMSEFIRNKKKENKETTKGVISLFGLTASIICAVAYHPIMIGFGTVMMFSLLGSITKTFNSYEGESLKEYKNLYLTAEKADKIIEKNRRYYL